MGRNLTLPGSDLELPQQLPRRSFFSEHPTGLQNCLIEQPCSACNHPSIPGEKDLATTAHLFSTISRRCDTFRSGEPGVLI